MLYVYIYIYIIYNIHHSNTYVYIYIYIQMYDDMYNVSLYMHIYIHTTHTHKWCMNDSVLFGDQGTFENHETPQYPVGWWFYGLMTYPILLGMITIGNLSGNLIKNTDLTKEYYKGWGFWRHFLDASLLHCSNFLRIIQAFCRSLKVPSCPDFFPDFSAQDQLLSHGGLAVQIFVSRNPAGWCCRGFYYPIPVGSMVLVYMLTWLGYIDGKCYHI